MSRYQKGKTNLFFTEARDSEWQWHQLGHMQVCTLLQTDNHASTPPLSFLQAGCPSCRPTNSVKALEVYTPVYYYYKYCYTCLMALSRTTWVSRYQKVKTSLDLNQARDDGVFGMQWHQLDHVQTICTLLKTDNHTNTPSLNIYRQVLVFYWLTQVVLEKQSLNGYNKCAEQSSARLESETQGLNLTENRIKQKH